MLDPRRQGAIVDQRAANGADPPDLVQHLATHQHASSGRGSAAMPGTVDPEERVELLEEEDEGRDQQATPEPTVVKTGHQRDHGALLGLAEGHQPWQRVRRMEDVGVGQQHPLGPRGICDMRKPGLDSPHFARPALRQRRGRDDLGACLAGQRGGGVVGRVVNDDHPHASRIVAGPMCADHFGDRLRLVAGRNDDGDPGPDRRRRAVGQALSGQPESPPEHQEDRPGQQDKKAPHALRHKGVRRRRQAATR